MTRVSISQEGIDPINIEMEQEKSQESALAAVGIGIGAFFVLGIVSAIIGNVIDNAKFKKAYKSCSEEEQKKVKPVLVKNGLMNDDDNKQLSEQ